MAIMVGVFSGLGAAAFYAVLHASTRLILGTLVGHRPATLAVEGGVHPATGFSQAWAVPLVVAAGALLATALVLRLAPEAAGHGTDAAIAAAHHDPAGTPTRVAFVKLAASSITIGSGGSGGSEGPTAQITAAFASSVARTFRLPFERAKRVVVVGMASGVGAIFRTPLAGASFGVEMLYRRDFEPAVLIPGLVASLVAYVVFGLIHGFGPIFGAIAYVPWAVPQELLAYPVIGLMVGLVGRLYIHSYYTTTRFFSDAGFAGRLPQLFRPVVAGLVVGTMGLIIPGVLGTGYGIAQAGLDKSALVKTSLWIILAIPFAKIMATSLSIGSGGSGGIFGPGIVIGASSGAAIWRLLEPYGLVPESPAAFVIAGMAACLGTIARVPVALVLMAMETTGNPWMMLPAALATGVAYVVVGDRTLYRSQLRSRADAPTGPSAARTPHTTPRGQRRAGSTVDSGAEPDRPR